MGYEVGDMVKISSDDEYDGEEGIITKERGDGYIVDIGERGTTIQCSESELQPL